MSKENQITDPIKLQKRIDKIKANIEILKRKINNDEWESSYELNDLYHHLNHEEKELKKFENRLKALEETKYDKN
jgi:hypothetical protein